MKTTLNYNTIETLQVQKGWKEYLDNIVAQSERVFDDNLISEYDESNGQGIVRRMEKTDAVSPKYAVLNFRKDLIPLIRKENVSLRALLRLLSIYGCRIKADFDGVVLPHTFKIQGNFDSVGVRGYHTQNRTYDHDTARTTPQNVQEDADCFIPNMSNNAFEEDTTFKYIYNVFGYNQKNPMLSYSYVYRFEKYYPVKIMKLNEDYHELIDPEGSGEDTRIWVDDPTDEGKYYVRESDVIKVAETTSGDREHSTVIEFIDGDVPIYEWVEDIENEKGIIARMTLVEYDYGDKMFKLKDNIQPSDILDCISDPVFIVINDHDKIDLQKSFYAVVVSGETQTFPIIRYNAEANLESVEDPVDDDKSEYDLSYVIANSDFSFVHRNTFRKKADAEHPDDYDVFSVTLKTEGYTSLTMNYNVYTIDGEDGEFIIGDIIYDKIEPLAMHVREKQLFAEDSYIKAQPLFVYRTLGERIPKTECSETANFDNERGGADKLNYEIKFDNFQNDSIANGVYIEKKSTIISNDPTSTADLVAKDVFYSRKYMVYEVYKRVISKKTVVKTFTRETSWYDYFDLSLVDTYERGEFLGNYYAVEDLSKKTLNRPVTLFSQSGLIKGSVSDEYDSDLNVIEIKDDKSNDYELVPLRKEAEIETMYFNHFVKVYPIVDEETDDVVSTHKLYCDNLELVEYANCVPYIVSYDRKGTEDRDCSVFGRILSYNKRTHLITVNNPIWFANSKDPKYVVVAYQNMSPFMRPNRLTVIAPDEGVKGVVSPMLDNFRNAACYDIELYTKGEYESLNNN